MVEGCSPHTVAGAVGLNACSRFIRRLPTGHRLPVDLTVYPADLQVAEATLTVAAQSSALVLTSVTFCRRMVALAVHHDDAVKGREFCDQRRIELCLSLNDRLGHGLGLLCV